MFASTHAEAKPRFPSFVRRPYGRAGSRHATEGFARTVVEAGCTVRCTPPSWHFLAASGHDIRPFCSLAAYVPSAAPTDGQCIHAPTRGHLRLRLPSRRGTGREGAVGTASSARTFGTRFRWKLSRLREEHLHRSRSANAQDARAAEKHADPSSRNWRILLVGAMTLRSVEQSPLSLLMRF